MPQGPDEPFLPQVVIVPEAQADLDAAIERDPELAKAMASMKESMMNAMQGVHDGRYESFEDAIEAITGQRPERVAPPNPPKHGYFLAVAPEPKGDGYLAVITDGHPKHGHDPITVMDVGRFKSKDEAETWGKETVDELPWRISTAPEPRQS